VSLEGGEQLQHITHVWTVEGAMSKQRAVEDLWSGRSRYYVVLPTGRIDVAPGAGARPQSRQCVLRPAPRRRARVAARRDHDGQPADPAPAAEPDAAAAQPGDGQSERVLSRRPPADAEIGGRPRDHRRRNQTPEATAPATIAP
jgi:hypothetical protein